MTLLSFILGGLLSLLGLYFYYQNHPITKWLTSSCPQENNQSQGLSLDECGRKVISNVPILMYHHIKSNPDPKNQLENSLDVSPENFKEQMSYMNKEGYQTTTLDKLFPNPQGKKFIITIDDGYKDAIENAYPILKSFNYTATLFIITNDVGKEGYLSWDDIKTLKNEGWVIGSHTLNHPNLTNIKEDEAKKEITQSKEILESNLKTSIDFFCYPAGKFNQKIINLVQKANYKAAVTTIEGKTNIYQDIFKLKRIRVNGSESLTEFIEKLQ